MNRITAKGSAKVHLEGKTKVHASDDELLIELDLATLGEQTCKFDTGIFLDERADRGVLTLSFEIEVANIPTPWWPNNEQTRFN